MTDFVGYVIAHFPGRLNDILPDLSADLPFSRKSHRYRGGGHAQPGCDISYGNIVAF